MTLAVTGLTTHLNGRAILDAISLTAEPGWFGVLGANGSGKTTLLKTLCARLDVSGGDIVWQGKNLTADGALRARTFGFAPPLDTLPATVTAGELIRLVTDLRDCAPGQPGEIYDALGLAGLQDKTIGAMSSGMKQRVSVFCAFLGEPEVVLLDEPFNWLDPIATYDLKSAIRAWTTDNRTVVTALHDVGTFISRCDAGVLIEKGKVVRTFDTAQMAEGRRDPLRLEEDVYASFPRGEPVNSSSRILGVHARTKAVDSLS